MGRDDQTICGDIQDHLHQLLRRKAENGPPVRREFPEVSQFGTNGLYHFKTRGEDEIVNPSPLPSLGVDIAHLSG